MPYFPRPRFQSVSSTATLSREPSPSPLHDDASFVLHTQPSTSFRRSVSGLYRTPDQQGWYTPSPPPRSRAPSPSTPGAYSDDASRPSASSTYAGAWSPEPDELDSPPSSACASAFNSVSPPTSIASLPSPLPPQLPVTSVSRPLPTTAPAPTGTGAPTPRVCDQCRLRKIRCHRVHMDDSPCQTCIRRKKTCTWGNVDPPARRGKGAKLATPAGGFKGALAQRRKKRKVEAERRSGVQMAKKRSALEVCVVIARAEERSSTPEPSSPPSSGRDAKMYNNDDSESSEDEDMDHNYNDNYEVESNAGSLSSAGYAW